MNGNVLWMAAAGAAICGGWTMAVAGLVPVEPDPTSVGRRVSWRRAMDRLRRWGRDPRQAQHEASHAWAVWRWPTALAAGLVVWLLSGWPVAGLILAVAVLGVPLLLAANRTAARDIERAEAIEEWTRRLSDVLTAGTGLEQAITATVRTCPAPIEHPVAELASRLRARWPTETALRAFADDLDDAVGDLVVAALVLSARRRGPGLAKVLVAVADSLADEVALRRKVEAERAKPRTTARAVTAITLGVLGFMTVNTSYLQPYGSGLGQVALAVLAAGFAGALTWMHTLGRGRRPSRVLARTTGSDTGSSVDPGEALP
jgi:Flp pilus assembly protein TadB